MGVQYDTELSDGDFTARIDYVRRGDTFFDSVNTDFDLQEAYGLVSANIRYEKDGWFVSWYGKNFSYKEFITCQRINPLFACDCGGVGGGGPSNYEVSVGMS